MSSRENNISRRKFFFYGGLLAGAIPAAGCGGSAGTPSLTRLGYKSPNEKLNIACIGIGNRGAANVRAVNRLRIGEVRRSRTAASAAPSLSLPPPRCCGAVCSLTHDRSA